MLKVGFDGGCVIHKGGEVQAVVNPFWIRDTDLAVKVSLGKAF